MSRKLIEPKRTVWIYDKDAAVMEEFIERKKLANIADAVRICVEFTNAHGGLS